MNDFLMRLLFGPDEGGEGGGDAGDGGAGDAGDGGAGGDVVHTAFLETLPEDIRADEAFANINSIEDLAKQHVHVQPLIGKGKAVIPGSDATPEQVQEFYGQLGRPEKPEGYQVPTKGLPEGIKLDETLVGTFRTAAHDMNLTDQQFAAALRWQVGAVAKQNELHDAAVVAATKASVASLQQHYGQAYEESIKLANGLIDEFDDDDGSFRKVLTESGYINDPRMVKMFVTVAKAVDVDQIRGTGGAKTFAVTPGDAEIKLQELELDPEKSKALLDRDHPQHAAVTKERGMLQDAAMAGGKKK